MQSAPCLFARWPASMIRARATVDDGQETTALETLGARLDNETHELDLVAKAFRIISREISYRELAKALLMEALSYSGAVRGAILLSEGGELLAKADASFPRERANFLASFRRTPNSACRRPLRKRCYAREKRS